VNKALWVGLCATAIAGIAAQAFLVLAGYPHSQFSGLLLILLLLIIFAYGWTRSRSSASKAVTSETPKQGRRTYKTLTLGMVALAAYWAVYSILFGWNTQGVEEIPQEELARFFQHNQVGGTPDYAMIKNGSIHLLTIHGYADNRLVCEMLIKPYNEDESLSVMPGQYACRPLN
jgi:formate hydrogenlyase subunit 3/multisubunit Na+/H+ antiporter MnhD subunit